MTFEEFDGLVREAVTLLPAEFREILKKQQISVSARETVPQPLRRKNMTVYGVFVGLPYGTFFQGQQEPTRIELYKSSFDGLSDHDARDAVVRTVIHEIAHYFGFSEQEIRRLGY